ncbi:unnamed protein product [Vitrella brassicaformis CCMP3155]|uniref:Uncharacterized protein n=1 Tax=Vitrella brassicaformis (strain CCMP3155) TaxID=1169540 RepID=A0A0G4E8U0_VITBC|nr:unnamed protein product [Vitrella brassicaformis CCMP3155]|eukprot:CEL91914.1 unnamed protein product [Vitrella brassicaformis CCMP3155]
MRLEVPHGLEASAAAKIIRDGLTSLLTAGVRGLMRVGVEVEVYHMLPGDLGDAIHALLPDGTRVGGFTINRRKHEDGRIVLVKATRVL